MPPHRQNRPAGSEPRPARSVRVSDAVWDAAKERAESEGQKISDVINTIVEGYANNRLDLPIVTLVYPPYRPPEEA